MTQRTNGPTRYGSPVKMGQKNSLTSWARRATVHGKSPSCRKTGACPAFSRFPCFLRGWGWGWGWEESPDHWICFPFRCFFQLQNQQITNGALLRSEIHGKPGTSRHLKSRRWNPFFDFHFYPFIYNEDVEIKGECCLLGNNVKTWDQNHVTPPLPEKWNEKCRITESIHQPIPKRDQIFDNRMPSPIGWTWVGSEKCPPMNSSCRQLAWGDRLISKLPRNWPASLISQEEVSDSSQSMLGG